MGSLVRHHFMKRQARWCILAFLFVLFSSQSILPLTSVRGEVTHRISACDYFLVETRYGYDLLEWYGNYDPDKGDTLVGNYETYGFHDVLDETADETTHVYTEDYQLSKSDALEKLAEQCE